MKIELKNVKINKSFSQETTCFMASVYINGNRAAYAQNDGRGGNTYYRAYDRFAGLVEDAEKYCLTLPDEHVDLGNGSKFVLSQSLETVIDNLLIEKELEKEKKEIDKLCLSNIVWGKPNGGTYKYNVVCCHTCPSVFFHTTGAEHIVCPYCLVEGKPEDFSDLIHE